jgi:hypothetical protein
MSFTAFMQFHRTAIGNIKKAYPTRCAVMSVFFLLSVHSSSFASAVAFLGGQDDPHPLIENYQNEVTRMVINPFYNFQENLYRQAIYGLPDTRTKDECFKGGDAQDTAAENNLRQQSTIATDLAVVVGVQSEECIPHKVTRRFSPLELNPWYLTSVMRQGGAREPYQGRGYKGGGGQNPYLNSQRMVLPTITMQMGCAVELMIKDLSDEDNNPIHKKNNNGNNSKIDEDPMDPVWMRRELDNCVNQYILQQARFMRDADDGQGNNFGVNTGLCQPFRVLLPPTKHEQFEYVPSEYIAVAWAKLLVDSEYTYRDGAAEKEPNYERDTLVEVTKEIPVPGDKFGLILVPDLAEPAPVNLQFEKILDPSHPFTPRWDFERTDRSYSPLTVIYSFNPINAVRCSDTVAVDLLNFRTRPFDRWVLHKIGWNIACYTNPWCRKWIWRLLLRCSALKPCCSHTWNIADRWEARFGETIARLVCGVPIREVCNYVSRPLSGVNTLKLRNGNDENFPQGVPEGYAFKDYFGNHKPYMRCWDTNMECGELLPIFPLPVIDSRRYDFVYNPVSPIGSEFAVMGAGVEGQSCTIGGGLGKAGVANPDPISSWSELKLYYTRTMRLGAKCIGLHTKMFKADEGEDVLLNASGVNFVLPSKRGKGGLEAHTWPIPWKGFISDPDEDRRFPNFGAGNPTIETGLDQATVGDILLFDQDVVMEGNAETWRNPYIAKVNAVSNERFRNSAGNAASVLNPAMDYVMVSTFNHGRYIDACGMSDEAGMGPDITLYKEELPEATKNDLQQMQDSTDQCDDPRLSSCIEPYWDTVKRYVILEDVP